MILEVYGESKRTFDPMGRRCLGAGRFPASRVIGLTFLVETTVKWCLFSELLPYKWETMRILPDK